MDDFDTPVEKAKTKGKVRAAVRLRRMFFLGLAGAFIGYCLFLVNGRLTGRTPLPMPFGYGQAVVMSGSMSPAFEVDALLIIHEEDRYRMDDIVAFVDGDGDLVIHRIVAAEGGTVLTKGDANSAADEPISQEDIFGRVVFVIPWAGKIVRILQKPMAAILLLALVLIGLEWNYMQDKKAAGQRLEAARREVERLRDELKESEDEKNHTGQ